MHEEFVKKLRNRRVCIMQTGGLDDMPLLMEASDVIEELSSFHERMDHICAIQYMWCNGPYLMGEMVAYFDDRNITEDEARATVYSDTYDPRIVSMYRAQAEQVFGYKWLDATDDGVGES